MRGDRSQSPVFRRGGRRLMALSGARESACQMSSSLPSPSAESRTSSTSLGGRASASRLRAWPTSPSRLAPAEKSAANSSTMRSSNVGATAPSPAAARATVRRSGGSKCLRSRAAGGLPIISSRAAAFSGPLRVRSHSIVVSDIVLSFRQAACSRLAAATISRSDTPKRWLTSSTTTISPRATTLPLTTMSTGSPTR